MSLTTSNTYITPTNTTSVGIARGQINGSLRAIMQNFYSSSAPVNTNISDDGSTTDPYPGTLYLSSNSLALYRMSASTVSGGYYATQKFTRRGISYRVETDATSATANITSGYETGELYYRLDNNKYYFRKSDGSSEQLASGTITVDDGSITPAKLATGNYLQFNTTGNIAFNNSTATSSTVRSDTVLSIRNSALQFPSSSLFFEPSSHATSRHVKYDLDNWSFRQDFGGSGSKDLAVYDKAGLAARLYIDTSGRVSVGGTTSGLTSTFTVTGSLTTSGATTFTAGTSSISTATGTLVITGGAGISGNTNIGGNVAIGSSSFPRARVDIVGASIGNITTLTDAATVTPNFASNNYFTLTFTSGVGNTRTIANPTNLVAGQSGVIYLIQDSVGNRQVSWGSYYRFPNGTAPTLTTTGNANDAIAYSVRSSTAITCQAVLNV